MGVTARHGTQQQLDGHCCFVDFAGHWTHVCTPRHSRTNYDPLDGVETVVAIGAIGAVRAVGTVGTLGTVRAEGTVGTPGTVRAV